MSCSGILIKFIPNFRKKFTTLIDANIQTEELQFPEEIIYDENSAVGIHLKFYLLVLWRIYTIHWDKKMLHVDTLCKKAETTFAHRNSWYSSLIYKKNFAMTLTLTPNPQSFGCHLYGRWVTLNYELIPNISPIFQLAGKL